MPTYTVAADFKDAFYQVALNLFQGDPDVQVSFGHPSTTQNADLIMFTSIGSTQVEATMSTLRGREETLTLDVFISSKRAGTADDDRIPTQRVYQLLGILENYVRTNDTTLGGVVRQCFLTASTSVGVTDTAVIGSGRMVDCVATFTALVRITN